MSNSVPSTIYDRAYYLTDCTGYEEFLRSKGIELDRRLKKIIHHLKVSKGQHLLDVGCGRGEIVFFAARHGLYATGIDYSVDAIKLATEAYENQNRNIQLNSKFLVMNAKKMEFKDSQFDWVVMTDVVEHLYSDELKQVYSEVYRVLKPDGKLLIHTEPNKIYNDLTYPYYCYPLSLVLNWINFKLTKNRYPGLPHPSILRTEYHKKMHINEATYVNLSHQLKEAGFKIKIETGVTILKPHISWKDVLFNILVCADPLSRWWPLNTFFANDFVILARKMRTHADMS